MCILNMSNQIFISPFPWKYHRYATDQYTTQNLKCLESSYFKINNGIGRAGLLVYI